MSGGRLAAYSIVATVIGGLILAGLLAMLNRITDWSIPWEAALYGPGVLVFAGLVYLLFVSDRARRHAQVETLQRDISDVRAQLIKFVHADDFAVVYKLQKDLQDVEDRVLRLPDRTVWKEYAELNDVVRKSIPMSLGSLQHELAQLKHRVSEIEDVAKIHRLRGRVDKLEGRVSRLETGPVGDISRQREAERD